METAKIAKKINRSDSEAATTATWKIGGKPAAVVVAIVVVETAILQ